MISNKQQILVKNALKSLRNDFSQAIGLAKKQYRKKWNLIGENISNYLCDYLKNSHKEMIDNGYFLPISQFGFSYIEKINSYIKDKDHSSLEKFILSLLKDDRNIQYLYKEWDKNKYFKNRERFIRKGIQAHFESDYISSIPILMPHIEGIFHEFFIDIGIIKIENTKKFQGNTAVSLLKRINVVNFSSDIDKIYFRKFVSKIKIFDYNSNSKNHPNRGRILHGLDLNYDREIWSAQMIFLLNFVFNFTGKEYSIISTDNGTIKLKEKG